MIREDMHGGLTLRRFTMQSLAPQQMLTGDEDRLPLQDPVIRQRSISRSERVGSAIGMTDMVDAATAADRDQHQQGRFDCICAAQQWMPSLDVVHASLATIVKD
jgi:hypothetical protein